MIPIPQHTNPIRADRTAIAPYNFVPLPEKLVEINPEALPDQDRYLNPHHSGYVECRLTTESPLYVRCALTDKEFEDLQDIKKQKNRDKSFLKDPKNKPDFFYTHEVLEPVIPGSSLRGCLRNLVEIAAYAKIDFVTDQPLVYRAVGDTTSLGESYRKRLQNKMRAGYMRDRGDNSWEIIPAQEWPNEADSDSRVSFFRVEREKIPRDLQQWKKCANAWRVHFKPEPTKGWLVEEASVWPGSELREGVVVRTGKIPRKRKEFIFNLPDENADPIPISNELIARYRGQITKDQEQFLGHEDAALKENQPIFYLLNDKDELEFFGHAMMFRLPYESTPKDFVPVKLREDKKEPTYDLADALLGYTKQSGERKRRAYASRINITDATLAADQEKENIWLGEASEQFIIVPAILAGPKPTTFQHYLVQDRPDDKKALQHWASPTPAKTVIRGHKLYWHKGNITTRQLVAYPVAHPTSTQHTQCKPVRSGVRFNFRIYFDNLSDVELGALLWALQLPGNAGMEYRHKIGMGKPLGMGAVKLTPVLHLINRKQRYSKLFESDGWLTGAKGADPQVESLTKQFEAFILQRIGAKEAERLAEVERIRMLLKMYEWPGPEPQWTRYMEIERLDPNAPAGKRNEYKDRPVLPDPLHITGITGESAFVTGEQERVRKAAQQGPVPQRKPAKMITPKTMPEPAAPPAPDLPVPKQLLEALQARTGHDAAKSKTRPLRSGAKVKAEVLQMQGGKITVRLLDPPNAVVSFDQPYYPYRPGDKVQVKVIAVDEKTGQIKKVLPA